MSNVIPVSLTSLVGREQEIETLCQLLRRPDVRLVTITGPGGVGKTSLALQVAHDLQDAFIDGVFFISLAAISDSTIIIPTIVHALGVFESPNRLLLDSLKEFLRDRQVLLLLDNFEQIMSAAPLLSEMLSACAGLRILATSRETLHLRGEQEFPLSPFTLPNESSVEMLMQYSPMEQLRDLLLRLSQDWHKYCTFQSEPVVPWTNNASERSIGKMKMRARTVRGYKSWPGMQSGLLLAATDLT